MTRIFSRKNEELWMGHLPFSAVNMEDILKSISWKQNRIRIFGKWYDEPRLTAWFGPSYTYSGIQWPKTDFPHDLLSLKGTVEQLAEFEFNAVLLNYYRTGKDSMGWHRDNEPEMDQAMIASVSLGARRVIKFRNRNTREQFDIPLADKSVLLMKDFQQNWEHSVPKRLLLTEPRLNLTFRRIIGS